MKEACNGSQMGSHVATCYVYNVFITSKCSIKIKLIVMLLSPSKLNSDKTKLLFKQVQNENDFEIVIRLSKLVYQLTLCLCVNKNYFILKIC